MTFQISYAQMTQQEKRQIRALHIGQILIRRFVVVETEFLQVLYEIVVVYFLARLWAKRSRLWLDALTEFSRVCLN